MSGIIGFQPLLAIISHIFSSLLLFMHLQAIMPEKIIKKNRVMQAQILFILLSIAIGWAVSNFFLEISYWSGSFRLCSANKRLQTIWTHRIYT